MRHVICFRPGMHRGGRPNPRHAVYEADAHTPAQILDLVADPECIVIEGGEMVTSDAAIAAVEAEGAKKVKGK